MPMFTDLFEYRDGELYRKKSMGNAFPAGSKVGGFDSSSGYLRTKVNGKSWLLHRIVYALHNEELPEFLDHIDQNKLNNRIENLRPCTKSENVVNSRVRVDNPYGYKGVTFHRASGKFAAQSFVNGKRVHIGLYKTPEEAALAYNKKAKELFGEFAALNQIKNKEEVY